MPQRQDRLRILRSMYHATHARTHAHEARGGACDLACGTGSCIFYSRLTCASHPPRILFFFLLLLFLSRSRRDFFAATRPRNPRFPRKILLSQWRSRISYSSVMYVFFFLNIDAPHACCVEFKIQTSRRFIRKNILKEHSTKGIKIQD